MNVKLNKKNKKKDSDLFVAIFKYFFRGLAFFLLLFIVAYIFYLIYNKYVNDPKYIIQKYDVAGNKTISSTEILELFKDRTNDNIYVTFLDSYYERLTNHPNVKNVKITKIPPDKLRIKIEEYDALAVIKNNSGLKFPISDSGKILSEKKLLNSESLPQLIGMPSHTKYVAGKYLEHTHVLNILKYIKQVNTHEKKELLDVSYINLSNYNDMVFYANENNMEIHFNENYDAKLIDKLFLILQEFNKTNKNIKKIDMRFNNFPTEFEKE